MPTSLSAAFSSETQSTSRLHAGATLAKTKKFMKVVRTIYETKRTSRAARSDVHRVFDDELDPHMLVEGEDNGEKYCIQPVDEERRADKDASVSTLLSENGVLGKAQPRSSGLEYCVGSKRSPCARVRF